MPMDAKSSRVNTDTDAEAESKNESKTLPLTSGEFSGSSAGAISNKHQKPRFKLIPILLFLGGLVAYTFLTVGGRSTLQAESVDGPNVEITGWSVTSALPQPIAGKSAIVFGEYIFLFGGRDDSEGSLSTVYSAPILGDGRLGNWGVAGTMPKPLYLHATTIFENDVYVIGGWNANEANLSASPSKAVWRGQITNDGRVSNWVEENSYPTEVTLHQAVVINQRVFVIGGFASVPQESLNDVYYADINPLTGQLGEWQSSLNLPQAVRRASVTTTNVGGTTYIYVTGGLGQDPLLKFSTVYYSAVNNDGSLAGWQNATALPDTREYHSAVIHDGRLVVLGGRNTLGEHNTVYAANINTGGSLGSWRPLASLPTSLYRFGAVSVNRYGSDFLIILGGFVGSSTRSEVYHSTVPNTPTPTFTPTPTSTPTPTPMPTPTPGLEIDFKSEPYGWVGPGDQVLYTIDFMAPTAPLTDVRIESHLPENVILLPNSITVSSPYQYTITGNAINWQIGDLEALDSGRVSYQMVRPTPEPPPLGTSNVLQITLFGPTTANSGEQIEYRLSVKNQSVIPLTDLVVKNTVPFGATFIDSSGTLPIDGEVLWQLPILAPLATETFTYTVVANTILLNNRYGVESKEGPNAIGYIYVTTNIENQRPLVGDNFKIVHNGAAATWKVDDTTFNFKTDSLTNPTFSTYVPLRSASE